MNQARPVVENHLSAHAAKWFAISTRFKAEKEVARLLAKRGIECYVPLNRVVRQYTRKRKVVQLPLIPCYAFVYIKANEYVTVLETNHVVKFIHFSRNLISIPESEIQLLKRVCQEIDHVEIQEMTFEKWRPVEIIGGNLTGIRGKLVDCRGKNFLIELDHIGIGMRIEIDQQLLRPSGHGVNNKPIESAQFTGTTYWLD
ncbi:MAG: UpxY family transcription antiterminator [Saprospiraceae bacterium]|nr:UpxY family transcription antiterminator [Saprospiraceae bacterium]